MADASSRFPPLYITACIIFAVGVAGLGCLLVLQPSSHIIKGFFYIFVGFIAFGTGEFLNHPKTPLMTVSEDDSVASPQFYRKRNACSLGNLCDIAALLLFFAGLSTLLYPK
jgi:hypothetical protein